MRVYTDGSCRNTVGGWAWWNEETGDYASGAITPTTNQRMELYAALDAVDSHLDAKDLVIVSDSAYLVNCFRDKWYEKWEKRKWRGHEGRTIANADIWKPLIALVKENGRVQFEWVKGHNGDYGNEMADRLAQEACLKAALAHS
jgi:ribonuclease HI